MATATLTSKGQVTIPKKVRDALHLTTGDIIEIVVQGKGEAVLRPVSKKASEVFGKLYKAEQQAISPEQMNEAIRERMLKGRK